MILGMGAPELLVILLVTLVIFGPKNLPKLGSALGQTVKSVREGMEESDAAAAEKVKSEVSEASTEAQTASSQKKSCPKSEVRRRGRRRRGVLLALRRQDRLAPQHQAPPARPLRLGQTLVRRPLLPDPAFAPAMPGPMR